MGKNRKHILIISSWYPSQERPFLGIFVLRFIELIAKHHQVTVLVTLPSIDVADIHVVNLARTGYNEVRVLYPKQRNPLLKLLYQIFAFHKGLKTIKEVDFIHGHIAFPKGYQFIWAKKKLKKPLIITEHSSIFREEKVAESSLFMQAYWKSVFNQADYLLVVSELLKRDLKKLLPLKEITVLPNAISTDKFQLSPKETTPIFQFLHVSTLDDQLKNPQGILNACKRLIQEGITNFHLTVVSDEPYKKWQTYCFSKQISKYVTFVGPLQEDELIPYYQQCDAFILFSNYETFSIVIAEAWACGKPIISTPVGIAYELPEHLGYSTPIQDEKQLAENMERMMLEAQHFNPDKIRNHALQFERQLVLNRYNAILEKVVSLRYISPPSKHSV